MKFDVIMLTYNGLPLTVEALQSLALAESDFRLIIVDNGSSDGTQAWLQFLKEDVGDRVELVLNETNLGVPAGINAGLRRVSKDCDYIVLLNNDIVLPKDSLSLMVEHIAEAEKVIKVDPIGMIAPAMNFVAGLQFINVAQYGDLVHRKKFDDIAELHRENFQNMYLYTSWLCGSCLIMKREVFERVGFFDTRFSPGGFEDNDFCVRAQLLGWKLAIDYSTYVHHYGSQTLSRPEFEGMRWGTKLADVYLEKWQKLQKPDQKLIAAYRVKDGGELFRKSLERTAEFVDGIVVLSDNSTDDTVEIAKSNSKLLGLIDSNEPFDERRDRNNVLNLAKEKGADWTIVIDHDEFLDDTMTYDWAHRMMLPADPATFGWGFHFYNFFHDEFHWRADAPFGKMQGTRMYRVLPNQKITGGTEIGLHCSSVPVLPTDAVKISPIRYKHMGFTSEEQRQRKYAFYQEIDQEKDEVLIGRKDYGHLIAPELMLVRFQEHNTINFTLLASTDPQEVMRLMMKTWNYFNEVMIVDSENRDSIKKIAEFFKARHIYIPFENDFASFRNQAIEQTDCNWIFTMDADEDIPDILLREIRKLIEVDLHGYLFGVNNYHKEGAVTYTEVVRLFKNIPEIRFTGIVHEDLNESFRTHDLNLEVSPFRIEHFGYLKEKEQMQKKMELYESLCEKEIEKDPTNPKGYFNLALHFINRGNYDTGFDLLKQAERLDEKFFHPRAQMMLYYLRLAQDKARETMPLLPNHHPFKRQVDEILNWLNQKLGEKPLIVS